MESPSATDRQATRLSPPLFGMTGNHVEPCSLTRRANILPGLMAYRKYSPTHPSQKINIRPFLETIFFLNTLSPITLANT